MSLIAILVLGLGFTSTPSIPQKQEQPPQVKILQVKGRYLLLRNGKPYFIKGVGGEENLPLLKKSGGNSIRTWGAENKETLLDSAHKQGLSVTLGLWLGHLEHGFKYDDPKMVADQLEQCRKFVRQYRKHPALLFWGLGNEMEGNGENPLIWKAVEEIAKMVKEEDPNHPTMTVVAEISPKKIENLKRSCPHIDVLGINSYGGLASLAIRLRDAGWDRPFVVTEFGPNGHWECAKTPWGAPIEPSSTSKATTYLTNYTRAIATTPGWCLGSYAFLWGHKQEATSTWFGLLLKDGTTTEAVDMLTYVWTGKYPKNRAPMILTLETPVKEAYVPPGSDWAANVLVQDPEGDPVTVVWELRSESADRKSGGDAESEPPAHPESLLRVNEGFLRFRVPTIEGAYRLFVIVTDNHRHSATMNIPFYVGKKP